MITRFADADLRYPFAEPPGPGEIKNVADGILWFRVPLPFRLDHINVYLIEDGDGWAVLDTGIGNDETRRLWRSLSVGRWVAAGSRALSSPISIPITSVSPDGCVSALICHCSRVRPHILGVGMFA